MSADRLILQAQREDICTKALLKETRHFEIPFLPKQSTGNEQFVKNVIPICVNSVNYIVMALVLTKKMIEIVKLKFSTLMCMAF